MIWTILIGFVIGVVAKFLMPGSDPGGFVITILLGVSGSMLATWLGGALGIYLAGEAASFIAAVLGAMLILFVYRIFYSQNKTA